MDPTFKTFEEKRKLDQRLAFLTHDMALAASKGVQIIAGTESLALPIDFDVTEIEFGYYKSDEEKNVLEARRVWARETSLAETCGHSEFYNFVIADRVIQYTPDILKWFREVYDVLRPGGVLNVSFSHHRQSINARRVSTVGEAIEASHLNYSKPSVRQLFDYNYDRCNRGSGLKKAYSLVNRSLSVEYNNCICWYFTPVALIDFLYAVTSIGVFPFTINNIFPEMERREFYVSFRRDSERASLALRNAQLGGLRYLRDRLIA